MYLRKASFEEDFDKGHRLYVAGIQEMNPGKVYYPDANFTMRLTTGRFRIIIRVMQYTMII